MHCVKLTFLDKWLSLLDEWLSLPTLCFHAELENGNLTGVSTDAPHGGVALDAAPTTALEVIVSDLVPVTFNLLPMSTSPTHVPTVAVQMVATALGPAIEPAALPGVGVAPVQPPVATNLPPVTLMIAIQSLHAVPVGTYALVAISPPPLSTTVETVVVGVPPQHSPPPPTVYVAIATPSVQHALAVQMAANAFPPPPPFNRIASAGAASGSSTRVSGTKQLAAVGGKCI